MNRMSRYIDADKIKYKNGIVTRIAIEEMPTADVKPIVDGEWELVDDTFDEMKDYKCNLCGQLCAMSIYKMMNFCPNCGADMRKESEEEE